MKTIPLSQGLHAIVDDEDYESLSIHKWCASKDVRNQRYYAVRTVSEQGRSVHVSMHRIIIGAQAGQLVDHRNGDGLDNRRSNLRIATTTQNTAHQFRLVSTNTSGYRGVSWCKNAKKWRAGIRRKGVSCNLGYFSDPVDAALVYDRAAIEEHGEFASLNFGRPGAALKKARGEQ